MQDFFSQNNIKGVIFDCDGVLVDSEKLSCSALNVVFERHFQIDIGSDYSQVLGKSLKDGFKYYIETYNLIIPSSLKLTDLYNEKDRAYQDLARNNLQTFPGVKKLLNFLQNTSYKVAVASSGSLEKINFNLHQGKLEGYFSIISSADEVQHGKPQPDLFLLSAKKMNLNPENCVVIEDSVSGIKAAKAANMMAIGVTNSFDGQILLSAGADRIVTRLDELLKT